MYNIALSLKKHRLYSDFQVVKERLAAHQFVCWLAGGAVRDFCLNREVDEFDLVTDANTENLKKIFPEALLVGENFGVLKIPLASGDIFDLTTFREESDYVDGRRPSHVSAATPLKDSERRDFTVNSLFWNDVSMEILDYRGGLFDLSRSQLICVGDPEVRFSEDYLRIMRLVRFSAQLRFDIDKATDAAAIKYCSKISKVSGERIWVELKKIERAKGWNFVFQQKLFRLLLQEIFSSVEIKLQELPELVENIFVIFYLLNPGFDLTDLLKTRLKLSNQELVEYTAIRFLMVQIQNFSVEELTYEIEKWPLCMRQMSMLVQSGLMDKTIEQSVKNILSSYPEPLIAPKEMLDLMPHRYISEEMRFLRVSQFKSNCRTKGEVVEYLKKKYAVKRENT